MIAHLHAVDREHADPPLTEILESATGSTFVEGNAIEVLRNGDQIFPAMLRAIEDADDYVDFLTYVYWEGEIARRFAHTLAERARAGIEVRVLLDGYGAAAMDSDLARMMRDAGADVRYFRSPVRWRFWQTPHRTHRKVLVVDGEVAFTGGVGIADEWTGDARDPDEWRDTHLEIRGPAVAGLQAAFTGNWVEECDDVPVLARAVSRRPVGSARVLSMRSTASVGWSDVATLVWAAIANAKRRIEITTAYFVPDERSVTLLKDAAERGVEVNVLVPGPHNDMRVCDLAHGPEVWPLIESGVRIHRYQPTMIHAKVMLVDDLAIVGSPNFNHRSMRQDDECCVVIDDEATVRELEQHLGEDLQCAALTTRDQWARRPWYRRALEWLTSLFRHQL